MTFTPFMYGLVFVPFLYNIRVKFFISWFGSILFGRGTRVEYANGSFPETLAKCMMFRTVPL